MKQMGSLMARLRTLFVGLMMLGCAGSLHADEGFKFDHFKTGFALEGAHATVECESCHTKGVFEGTPNQCVNCHMEGGAIGATSKHTRHIPTMDTCEDCHTTDEWTFVARVDHAATLGSCVGCHDRISASGQPANHIPHAGQCDDCHITQEWAEVRFDHDVVDTSNCYSCHDGGAATGKPADHIAVQNNCGACHSDMVWVPTIRVDHDEILNVENCLQCHASDFVGHPISPVDPTRCNDCHFTTQWAPVRTVDHSAIPTDNCASCHGSTASGKPTNHILVNDAAPCQDCHKDTMVWFVEPTMGVDHSHVQGTCMSCHNNVIARGQHPEHDDTGPLDCNLCHKVNENFEFSP